MRGGWLLPSGLEGGSGGSRQFVVLSTSTASPQSRHHLSSTFSSSDKDTVLGLGHPEFRWFHLEILNCIHLHRPAGKVVSLLGATLDPAVDEKLENLDFNPSY